MMCRSARVEVVSQELRLVDKALTDDVPSEYLRGSSIQVPQFQLIIQQ